MRHFKLLMLFIPGVLLVIWAGLLIYSRSDIKQPLESYYNKVEKPIISESTNDSADLSSILIYTEEFVDVSLNDENGSPVGEILLEESIQDPSGEAISTAKTLKNLYLLKPEDGIYYLDLSSPKDFNANIYFYDTRGEVNTSKIMSKGSEKYMIKFDKDNSSNSTLSSQQ